MKTKSQEIYEELLKVSGIKDTPKVPVKRLSKVERRLIVVKDAISQLKKEIYDAESGTFINIIDYIVDDNSVTVVNDIQGSTFITDSELKKAEKVCNSISIQPLLEKFFKNKNNSCRVCARGALLLSTIHKENKFNLTELVHTEDNGGSYDPRGKGDIKLKTLFSEKQICMMETAFEGDNLNEDYLEYDISNKCILFGEMFKDDNKRLLAIFNNVVKNNGLFVP